MSDQLPGYAEGWHGTGGPTIPERHRYPPDCPAPVKLTVPPSASKAIASRAFRHGAMIFGAVGFVAGWLL